MNQILSTENNSKTKNKNTLNMKKICIIFSTLLIVFALVILGAKIYGIVEKKNNSKPISFLNKPEITIEKVDNVCVLNVNYDEGLNKITYYWNDGDIIEKNMNGSTIPFTTQITIPEGEYNILYIEATGIDGSVNEVEKMFTASEIVDAKKPVISWYYNEETRKIEITAISQKGIESITYNWEDDEEIKIFGSEEQKEIKLDIDVKRGINEITITATDMEGNSQTKTDLIQATYAPVIKVKLVNNKTIAISVNHDMGFKKVIMNVNGEELIYDESNPQYSTDIKNLSTSIDVKPGNVTVKISVYTLEEEEKEYTYEASTQITE